MRARPGTKARQVKLTDDEWDALEAIAVREGLDWAGVPSRSEAVRWLIGRDDAAPPRDHVPIPSPEKSPGS